MRACWVEIVGFVVEKVCWVWDFRMLLKLDIEVLECLNWFSGRP